MGVTYFEVWVGVTYFEVCTMMSCVGGGGGGSMGVTQSDSHRLCLAMVLIFYCFMGFFSLFSFSCCLLCFFRGRRKEMY